MWSAEENSKRALFNGETRVECYIVEKTEWDTCAHTIFTVHYLYAKVKKKSIKVLEVKIKGT